MLKFRIFLWRYKNYRETNSIISALSLARKEAQNLETHFKQLQYIPKQDQPQSFLKKLDLRKELLEQQQIVTEKIKQVRMPTLNKHSFLEVLKLYNLSIQALLEGKREVMQNEKLILKDGQSVQQKIDKFKNLLEKLTNN